MTTAKMIGYIRYSPRVKVAARDKTKDVSEDNPANSVANQKDQIQRWLAAHNRDPIAKGDWIVDELTSARTVPLDRRDGGIELLRRIRRGDREVIATRIDRLFRSVVDGLSVLEAWRRQKVSLYLADGVVCDLSTTSGWACTTILLMTSEFYPRYVAEATSMAKRSQQRDGKVVSRCAPYGYSISSDDPSLLVPDEREQEALQEILRLHESGISYRKICRMMEDAGVRCRKLNGSSGAKWHHTTVRSIINRNTGNG